LDLIDQSSRFSRKAVHCWRGKRGPRGFETFCISLGETTAPNQFSNSLNVEIRPAVPEQFRVSECNLGKEIARMAIIHFSDSNSLAE
jgi:hypothetical protein